MVAFWSYIGYLDLRGDVQNANARLERQAERFSAQPDTHRQSFERQRELLERRLENQQERLVSRIEGLERRIENQRIRS